MDLHFLEENSNYMTVQNLSIWDTSWILLKLIGIKSR